MSQTYSEDEILDQLRTCKQRHGKCTPRLFREEDSFCSVSLVVKRFTSWAEAKERAGIEEDLSSETGRPRQYSDEQILHHLRECHDRNGKCTTETLSQEKDLVSPSVVMERFKPEDDSAEGGAWQLAKRKAGLESDERTSNSRPREYSDDEYLELVQECEERYGKVTRRLFDQDEDFPSSGAVSKRFDSWSTAKEHAGVSDGERSRYDDEELLEMLCACQERYEKCTAKLFASDDDFCSPETIQRRFESWNGAKRQAGIKSDETIIEVPVREDSSGEAYVQFDDQTLNELADRIADRLQRQP